MLAKGHFERECKMKEAERKHRREDKRNIVGGVKVWLSGGASGAMTIKKPVSSLQEVTLITARKLLD